MLHVIRSLRPALLAGALATSASAVPSYEILPLGLTDAEHTRNTGSRFSSAGALTDSGYVTGISGRYNGGATSLGQSTWLYDVDAGTTTRLGYFDAAHTRSSDGRQFGTFGDPPTESGYAVGHSDRFNTGFPSQTG